MADALPQPPLRTPLYDLHLQARAKMVDFAGWLMPIQYRSILAEHEAVRSAVGLFDLSHMGRLVIRGPQALELAEWLTVNDVRRLEDGQAQYSLFCNEQGAILDDIVVYRFGAEYLIVVNASNRPKLLDWIQTQRAARGFEAELVDGTFELAMIGVQGPVSQRTLQPLLEADLEPLGYYRAMRTEAGGRPPEAGASEKRVSTAQAIVARTGYTGEDGFEVMVAAARAPELWRQLLELTNPVQPSPCGLGARDTLRMEAGMALYGHEIDQSTNAYEAGLGRLVKLDKGDFVGREALAALRKQPPGRKLVGFQMVENAVPRQGYPILVGGREVGIVTSGGFAPSLRANIGMAYVPSELSELGQELQVLVRGRPFRAEIVPMPFYPHRTRRRGA